MVLFFFLFYGIDFLLIELNVYCLKVRLRVFGYVFKCVYIFCLYLFGFYFILVIVVKIGIDDMKVI